MKELSTPKQERWMAAHIGLIDAPAMIVVGAFDFPAGTKRQACFMQPKLSVGGSSCEANPSRGRVAQVRGV